MNGLSSILPLKTTKPSAFILANWVTKFSLLNALNRLEQETASVRSGIGQNLVRIKKIMRNRGLKAEIGARNYLEYHESSLPYF